MYPQQELIRLAAHKAALQRDIAVCRGQCARAAAGALQPLEWLDRGLAFWRRLSPVVHLVALPLGLIVTRTLARRSKLLGSLVSWSPLLAAAVRAAGSAVMSRSGTPKSSNHSRNGKDRATSELV
jgi:hypothetical protein